MHFHETCADMREGALRLLTLVACAAVVLAIVSAAAEADMVTVRLGQAPAGKADVPKRIRAKPPTAYVAEAREAPEIDGRLEGKAWADATVLCLARTLDGRSAAAQPTDVRLLRSGTTLYVAFRCTEPLLNRLQATRRRHDGAVWEDDSVEIFIGPPGRYVHVVINAAGSTYDAWGKDKSWHCGLRAAAGRESGAWTVETAVPLGPMLRKGETRTEWRANFTRNRRATGRFQESAWSPTYSDDSHVPSRFGTLLFRKPPADAGKKKPPPQVNLPSRSFRVAYAVGEKFKEPGPLTVGSSGRTPSRSMSPADGR